MSNTWLAVIFTTLFVFSACESETIQSNSPGGASLIGNVSGRVRLVDTTYHYSDGYISMPDRSGVVVRIEGTTFQASSDANGIWIIPNVPSGTYTASFDKPGFGRKKVYNIQHIGNGTLYLPEITLKKLPQSNIGIALRGFEQLIVWRKDSTWIDTLGKEQFVRIWDTIPNGGATFSAYYPGLVGFAKGAMFVSRSSQINPFDSSSYDLLITSGLQNDVYMYKEELNKIGYTKGERIFVRADLILTDEVYIDAQRFDYYGYYDYSRRKYIYTGFGMNPSEVQSFIMP